MDPIYRDLVKLLDAGQPLAFAVLTETKGSTPQKCGAKAIFLPDGRVLPEKRVKGNGDAEPEN